MSAGDRARAVLFWALMISLAVVWMNMHEMGRGSRHNMLVAFGPLVGVFALFIFVIGLEIGSKHRGKA